MAGKSAPRLVDISGDYQQIPGSFVVCNGIVNCACGSLKNTVKLVIEDRGSDMGGSPICMDVDTKPSNFASTFGICAKTGEKCILGSMSPKWNTPVKVPAYSRYETRLKTEIKNGKKNYTSQVQRVDYYPIILESSLICWHAGSAGLIAVYKNGQDYMPVKTQILQNINDNPLTGAMPEAAGMPWEEIIAILLSVMAVDGPIPVGDIIAAVGAVAFGLLLLFGIIKIIDGIVYWASDTPKNSVALPEITTDMIDDALVVFFKDLEDPNKRNHILQDKHNWNKLTPDPKDPKSWPLIVETIRKVLENGDAVKYKDATFIKSLDIGGHIVQVVFTIVDGVMRIVNAWIK